MPFYTYGFQSVSKNKLLGAFFQNLQHWLLLCWTNPFETYYCSQIGLLPFWGENKQYLKLPSRLTWKPPTIGACALLVPLEQLAKLRSCPGWKTAGRTVHWKGVSRLFQIPTWMSMMSEEVGKWLCPHSLPTTPLVTTFPEAAPPLRSFLLQASSEIMRQRDQMCWQWQWHHCQAITLLMEEILQLLKGSSSH